MVPDMDCSSKVHEQGNVTPRSGPEAMQANGADRPRPLLVAKPFRTSSDSIIILTRDVLHCAARFIFWIHLVRRARPHNMPILNRNRPGPSRPNDISYRI